MSQPNARVLADAPGEWDALVATCPGASPSHDPRLWHAMADVLPGFEARFVAVERGGALIGGAPLLIERRGFGRWLHALPYLLPGAPLAAADARVEVDFAVAAAIERLARELGVAGGEWVCDRAGDPVAPEALECLGGETRWFECARIDLSAGVEAAWRAAERKTRNEITQARARGLIFEESPARLEEAIALHAHQARHWAGHRGLPAALSRRLLEDGPARLFTVSDDRGVLCASLVLDGAHETFVWWSGAHEDARPRRAYPFLMWSIAEWAASRGRARLNLGASTGLDPVATFKRSLGARSSRYPVRWLDARHAGPASRALATMQAWLRAGRARGATG